MTTKAGKPYIVSPLSISSPSHPHFIHIQQENQSDDAKTLGYNIAHNGSLVTMAFSLGKKHKVWNIGIDVMRIAHPPSVSLEAYVGSLAHKVGLISFLY